MFHLTFAKEDLERVIDIESDRFQRLSYGEPAFQTEAGAVYGEYRINATDPWTVLDEKLRDLAFDVHPYKHTVIGFERDIKAMPAAYEYSKAFHRRFYRPENVVILVVGDVDPPATLRLIEKYYGPWQPGYQPPKMPIEPPQTAPRSARVTFPGRTLPILTLAYKGDAFDTENRDYVAARLLAELAFGPESDLYKELVLRRQTVESLGCEVPMNRDPTLFEITAMVKKLDDVPAVRQAILRTLREFAARPVDRQKLDDLKRKGRYGFLMGLDAPDNVAMALTRFAALTGGIDVIDRWYAACDRATPEEIMHAAGKYFVPPRRTEVLMTGEDDAGKPIDPFHEPTSSTGIPPVRNAPAVPPVKSSTGILPVKQGPQDTAESHRPDAGATGAALPADQCVFLPVKEDPTVSIRVWFRVGSVDDPPGKEGLAAVTASMLSEGATKRNSYEQILDKLAPLAAGYSADASYEMTVIAGRVHKDNLDRFLPLMIDAIREPAFRQDDLDRIKSQMLNYLEDTLRYSSDEELGKAVFYNEVARSIPHDYDHLPQGTIAGLRSISLDDVRRFYHQNYFLEDTVLGLAGGYDDATATRLRQQLAMPLLSGPMRGGGSWPFEPLSGRKVTIVEKDCSATAISLGFPLDVHRGERDWYALALANSWLGQHRNQNGHLYQVIREVRGLNYGDYTYLEQFPDGAELSVPPVNVCRHGQAFEMWIRPVPNADRHFAIRAALREFQKFVDNGMTQDDFDTTRKFLRKFVLHLAPTTMDRLGYAMDDRFYGIDGSHLDIFRRTLDELTLAEVNAAIKKHLQYKNLQIVFVTKDGNALKEALVHETPSPIKYAMPKPATVYAEDREISVFPLHIRAEDVRIVPVSELFMK